MLYFIDNIKTYANVNRKGRALQIFVQQFDHHLIADECSLDALKCEVEHEIQKQNEKYPRSRSVRLDAIEVSKGGTVDYSCGRRPQQRGLHYFLPKGNGVLCAG